MPSHQELAAVVFLVPFLRVAVVAPVFVAGVDELHDTQPVVLIHRVAPECARPPTFDLPPRSTRTASGRSPEDEQRRLSRCEPRRDTSTSYGYFRLGPPTVYTTRSDSAIGNTMSLRRWRATEMMTTSGCSASMSSCQSLRPELSKYRSHPECDSVLLDGLSSALESATIVVTATCFPRPPIPCRVGGRGVFAVRTSGLHADRVHGDLASSCVGSTRTSR
jgi:hypothetical protein